MLDAYFSVKNQNPDNAMQKINVTVLNVKIRTTKELNAHWDLWKYIYLYSLFYNDNTGWIILTYLSIQRYANC